MDAEGLLGLEKAEELMAWLKAEDQQGNRQRRHRVLWVQQPNHPSVSFYGQAEEVANEFRVYIKEGYPDINDVRVWSVRYVGYQMGIGFKTLDDLKAWLATCSLVGKAV
jgi:hypothetical protein